MPLPGCKEITHLAPKAACKGQKMAKKWPLTYVNDHLCKEHEPTEMWCF